VDTLFSALRSKAYIPYNATGSSTSPDARNGGDPIPLDVNALLASPSSPRDRSRKRPFDSRDDIDSVGSRPPPKGPRMHNQQHAPRHPRGDWGRGNGHRGGMHASNISHRDDDMSMNGVPTRPRHGGQNNGMPVNGPDPHAQKERPICRDYHSTSFISEFLQPY
jgi:RNA-binding protein 26